jgi:DNA end-binding protein Ku
MLSGLQDVRITLDVRSIWLSMRPIWKGAISFGLVNIPIALYPATRREELKFRFLRASDLSPVNYKRVAEADGKEVPWDQIVKGYEYEKGKFVALKEEDFKRADIEATQTVDIVNFVNLEEVDPLLFYKPYYMEVGRGGDKAYVLLRQALESNDKIGIAKVVMRARQHLAAIKPQKKGLMLELMRFPEELVDVTAFNAPKETRVSKPELQMASKLVQSMTSPWSPEQYQDEYRHALERIIEAKIEHPEKPIPSKPPKKQPSKIIDLVSVLEKSIQETGSKTAARAATKSKGRSKTTRRSRKKAA